MSLTTVEQISDLLKELNVPRLYNGKKIWVFGTTIEHDGTTFICKSGNCIFHIAYFELNYNKDILLGTYNGTLCVNLFLAKIEG